MTPTPHSDVTLTVNGQERRVTVDNRATLLDTLRERLGLTGSKKGCDHGQCGACTVLVEGRRTNSCLKLAVAVDGDAVTTIEGVAGEDLHPLQHAFLEEDALQCGYCTPGQVLSALGAIDEASRGWPSHVTADTAAGVDGAGALDAAEVRERLSGNICRCGAYAGICAAVLRVAGADAQDDTGTGTGTGVRAAGTSR